MTKEQAIEVLRCNTNLGYGIVIENESTQLIKEAIEMAIKALDQQPSEDCVSREGARQFLYEEIDRLNNDELYDIFSKIIDDMYNELPPVTPTRKSGLHWIERFDNFDKWFECPYCHRDSEYTYNYCPNCGADMRGTENGSN